MVMLMHARLGPLVVLVRRPAHIVSADRLMLTEIQVHRVRRAPVGHTLLSLRRHARAVWRGLLIQMLIRPHRAPTALQDSTRQKQCGLALTVLLEVSHHWTNRRARHVQ